MKTRDRYRAIGHAAEVARLEKAGALIVAEIERLERAAER